MIQVEHINSKNTMRIIILKLILIALSFKSKGQDRYIFTETRDIQNIWRKDCNSKIDIEQKYRFFSKSDTLKLVLIEENCISCTETQITMYYLNNDLHVILEDSFKSGLEIIDELNSDDSIKLKSLIEKTRNPDNLIEKDINIILSFLSEGKLQFFRKPMVINTYIYKVDFTHYKMKLKDMESFLYESDWNQQFQKERTYYFMFQVSNHENMFYFSTFDPKEYIFKELLKNYFEIH